jgi:hypothetical protein
MSRPALNLLQATVEPVAEVSVNSQSSPEAEASERYLLSSSN